MKLPCNECPIQHKKRLMNHFTGIVEVDAQKLKTDTPVISCELKLLPEKLKAARARTWNNSYPNIEIGLNNKISVTDGRHRIFVAAERGYKIDVSVPRNQVKMFAKKYDGVIL